MAKAEVLILKPSTMSYELAQKKAEGTEIVIDKDRAATFTPGLSQFREEIPKLFGLIPRFWVYPKTLLIYLEGASKCFELRSPKKLNPSYWTDSGRKKFVRKVVAKSKAEQKAITTWQFFVLLGVGAVGILLTILQMRGMAFI